MRLLLLVLLLAACAPQPAPPPPAGQPPAGAPEPVADACGAARYRSYVGRNRSELPPPAPGETRRVACNTCPVTMDYSERRLNVFYDQRTDVITDIRCG